MGDMRLLKVFVYGTLKRGEPNHHWLTRPENGKSRFLTTAKTRERLPLVIGTRFNIPFLLDKRGGSVYQVQGEVFEVDEQMFQNLDELEAYPTFYDREQQAVITPEGKEMDCWLYLMRKFPDKLLQKPHLETYRNTPQQPYCERSRRGNETRAIDDLAY